MLNGTMGIVNAQRSLNYIRTVAEFINQPQYKNVVPMFSVINEPAVDTIGNETMREL
jgi:glucan 1,3-beta-glucosidase